MRFQLRTSLIWPAPPAHPFLASSLCQRAGNLSVSSGAVAFASSPSPSAGRPVYIQPPARRQPLFFVRLGFFSEAFRGVDRSPRPPNPRRRFVGEAGVLQEPPAGVKLFFHRPELSSKPAGCLTFRPRRVSSEGRVIFRLPAAVNPFVADFLHRRLRARTKSHYMPPPAGWQERAGGVPCPPQKAAGSQAWRCNFSVLHSLRAASLLAIGPATTFTRPLAGT